MVSRAVTSRLVPARPLACAMLLLAGLVPAGLLAVGACAPLWYDESHYLTLALSISKSGYPLWYWTPGNPDLFLDSPPLVLYLESLLGQLPIDVAGLRTISGAVFAGLAVIALAAYLRGRSNSLLTIGLTVLFSVLCGYFAFEFVQIRMDLPLAALSFVVLIAVARIRSKETDQSNWAALLAVLVLSALAFLTKYQAICLTAALAIDALLAAFARERRAWMPLAAHLIGVACGLAVLVWIVMSSPVGEGSIIERLQWNFTRVSPGGSPSFDLLMPVLTRVAYAFVIPLALFALAAVRRRLPLRGDPLLRLSLALAVVVAAFNVVEFRMSWGAGWYYMAQAALPLGYIFARSLIALIDIRRYMGVVIATALLLANAAINLPKEYSTPQRWYTNFSQLHENWHTDGDYLVASRIAEGLGPREILLLDDWKFQGRAIPYWLGLPDRQGYLLSMSPNDAAALLERQGEGRVGALAFSGDGAAKILATEEWAKVASLIETRYERTDVPGAAGWTLYLARD
jgi:Dolichyl-phosphate-mannose-protein mannosyltransferase